MLARKQQELEETLSATEREFSNAISDHKDIQNKLKDEVRSLSQGLQSREQECADLKIRLSDSEEGFGNKTVALFHLTEF